MVATDAVGREQELATVARLFEQRRAGPWVVVIEGDAGIGKTTLWEAALDLARDRSWRVLAARPAEAEARFSYIAVRDLLGPFIDETIHGLPGPQRRAVETAFLRAEGRADAHAVSAGVLGMLRAVSASAPAVVERVPRGAWSPDGSQVVFRCRSRAGPTPPFKPCTSKLNGSSFRSFPWPLASAEPDWGTHA